MEALLAKLSVVVVPAVLDVLVEVLRKVFCKKKGGRKPKEV